MNKDLTDLIFRISFSIIFLGLGAEHIINDDLIQRLMPTWIPAPSLVSTLCGIVLMTGGILIIIGYNIRLASIILGAFIIIVTITVHAPALFYKPDFIDAQNEWMWSILQRSNFAKNLCLLGVCVMLSQYTPGRWSLSWQIDQKKMNEFE